MADVYKKIRGLINNILQFGKNGGQIKYNATDGVFEMRNADDNAHIGLRALAPVNDSDVVTKYYADSLEKPLIIKRQADCSTAIPNNTGTRGFVVVTTAGNGASIGDILYDDGSGSGQMAIVTAVEGRSLAVTDSLSGGTIFFDPDSIYIWDADGSAWTKIGDIGSVTGAQRTVRIPIDNTAQQDSTNQIPANARIDSVSLEITTAYSGGGTIQIGNTTTANLIMDTTDNVPQNTNKKWVLDELDVDWGASASVVRVTVGGTPAAGAGVVIVKWSNPLN